MLGWKCFGSKLWPQYELMIETQEKATNSCQCPARKSSAGHSESFGYTPSYKVGTENGKCHLFIPDSKLHCGRFWMHFKILVGQLEAVFTNASTSSETTEH